MEPPARTERPPGAATEQVALDEAFWSIVCADAELLSAEFDAIVEASTPPRPNRRGGGTCWPRRRRPLAPRVDGAVASGLQRGRPGHIAAYQRSPPRVPSLRPTN